MDHSCARPSEPWEVTDGYIYLMRELAAKYPQVSCAPAYAVPRCATLTEVADLDLDRLTSVDVVQWRFGR
jgi:hypothetical protein